MAGAGLVSKKSTADGCQPAEQSVGKTKFVSYSGRYHSLSLLGKALTRIETIFVPSIVAYIPRSHKQPQDKIKLERRT